MNRRLFQSAGLKVSAFVLALVIWFYFFAAREGISFTAGRTRVLDIPVEILEPPSSMFYIRVVPNYVEVAVKGSKEIIDGLSPEDLKVFVEVKGLREGRRYILPVRIHTGFPVKVVSREPQTVTAIITSKSFLGTPQGIMERQRTSAPE